MSKYTKEILQPIVESSKSYSDVLRSLGLTITGGNQQNLKKNINKHLIDVSHFKSTSAGQVSWNKKSAKEILVNDPKRKQRADIRQLRRALSESGVESRCEKCDNIGEWLEESIVLEIDHKDGNWRNNEKDNLRYLCPNCHSQTPSYYNRTHKSKCSCGNVKHRSSNQCETCGNKTRLESMKKLRRVKRPDKKLIEQQVEEMGYIQTGRFYGVSHNSIRKWLKTGD